MDFIGYVKKLKRSWPILLVCAVIGAGIGFYQSWSEKPGYVATSGIHFTTDYFPEQEPAAGNTYVLSQAKTYAWVAKSPLNLEKAKQKTTQGQGATEIIEADIIPSTSILEIKVQSANKTYAEELSNALAAQLLDYTAEFGPKGPKLVRANIVKKGTAAPVSSRGLVKSVGLAGTAGLLIGVGIATMIMIARSGKKEAESE